jgi:YgiT-type zinc finger domain-containing protein
MAPGTTTSTLERDGAVLVLQEIPATVCEACGDATFSVDVARRVEQIANVALAAGLRFGVQKYLPSTQEPS